MVSRLQCFVFLSLFTRTIISTAPLLGQMIINVPPDIAPRTIGADTIVNLLPGGTFDVRGAAVASDGGIVNVLGGRVGILVVRSGAIANVSGGGVHELFELDEGGQIMHEGGRTEAIGLRPGGSGEVLGGAVEKLGASSGTSLVLHGVDFMIDGVLIPGLDQVGDSVDVDIPQKSVARHQYR